MTEFDIHELRNNSVAYVQRLRSVLDVEPPYQRQGEVWSREKQQLLIDSIINRFDIPKIYFHQHAPRPDSDGRQITYSLVDGRQRLQAIWDFLDGKFTLNSDFELLKTGSKDPAGKTFQQLELDHPSIALEIEATSLEIMVIRTDDLELIEEMFSRLNEAVPLNAAEKRNGRGGPLRLIVRNLVSHPFFEKTLPFSNARYRHYDLATKFLRWVEVGSPTNVAKNDLDEWWNEIRSAADGEKRVSSLIPTVTEVLDSLTETFGTNDKLLASVAMVSTYFLLFMEIVGSPNLAPSRETLAAFDYARKTMPHYNDESSLGTLERALLTFGRLSQSPNSGTALATRVEVLKSFIADLPEATLS